VDHVSDFVKADIDSGVDSSSSSAANSSSSGGGGSGARREHTIVLGHSIGAYLGLEAMRRHPEHVHSFVGIMVSFHNNKTNDLCCTILWLDLTLTPHIPYTYFSPRMPPPPLTHFSSPSSHFSRRTN
jgi:pimeloyl-ACP methyl ester carboxylesterase